MTRIVYVNGAYLPYGEAAIHVEDRGFQFADAVYEVCEVRGGRLVDETRHLARLARSLRELRYRRRCGKAPCFTSSARSFGEIAFATASSTCR